jgi:mono/diheme cytochrome c family protein
MMATFSRALAHARRPLLFAVAALLVLRVAIGSVLAAPSQDDRLAEHGRQLLAQYQCGRCHLIPGVEGAQGVLAPSLAAFGLRSYIAGEWPNREALLVQWIVAPASLAPDTRMPAMGVGLADARAMALYLGRLQ